MYQRILVPTDGSALSDRAVQTAVDLAHRLGSALHALTVLRPFPYSLVADGAPLEPQVFSQAEQRAARQRLESVQAAARAAQVRYEAHLIEATPVWRGIVDEAERLRVDLIVMASHGRSGLAALVLGSETQRVLTHTQVPVLVVR
jgi:nucleotide-binding universal stress UspA family protein